MRPDYYRAVAEVTVIIPTHDHGPTLRHSVASVLGQTLADLEIVIIGDGMPPDAAAVAREVAALDERVRLVELPKGPRHGEIYRHEVLTTVESRHVFYLSDDDLWLPQHVEVLSGLLDVHGADFVTTRSAGRLGDGTWGLAHVDLAQRFHREAMLGGHNRIGLSDAGHTLAGYRRLPHGWRTTPKGTYTDLYMWQQWLGEPWARFVTAPLPTVLHFPSHERRDVSEADRLLELAEHRAVLTDPAARSAWLERLIADDFERAAWLEAHLKELEAWLADREAALLWHTEKLAEAAKALDWFNAQAALRPPE
jgi:Glycosyl transferase family 2